MQMTSASIVDGQIQRTHACRAQGGDDQSPSLTVHQMPAGARYLSVLVDDPDAVKPTGKVWVHWNMFNLPAPGDMLDIRAGQSLAGDEGLNSAGERGYQGMCPPDGVHTYRFAVFASGEPIDVDTSRAWTIDDFESTYRNRLLGKVQISGKF